MNTIPIFQYLLKICRALVLLSKTVWVIFRNLNKPHGLALDPQDPFNLYIAEEDKISKIRIYSEGSLEMLVGLPQGGRHTSRSIVFH